MKNRLTKLGKRLTIFMLSTLMFVTSMFVINPNQFSAHAAGSFEDEFRTQIVREGQNMLGHIKYQLNSPWHTSGTGYSTSNLNTECNGFVRRVLVNTIYALEAKGVAIPSAYAGLKNVTGDGLDMIGHLNKIAPRETAPSNLQNGDSEPNMTNVNAYLDTLGPGTVVYFEKPNGAMHWAIYAGKQNGVHMALHASPKYADGSYNDAYYEPFEELWLSKGSGYSFKYVYAKTPVLPGTGNILLQKRNENMGAIQDSVFTLYDQNMNLYPNSQFHNMKTDSNGNILIENRSPATYYLKEVSVRSPYFADKVTWYRFDVVEGQTATVSNGTNGVIINRYVRGELTMVKLSATGDPIANARFGIHEVNSNGSVGTKIDTITTDSTGTAVSTGKIIADKKYVAIEEYVDSPYQLDPTPHPFTIAWVNDSTPIVKQTMYVTNQILKVHLMANKVDEDGDALVGVGFQIRDTSTNQFVELDEQQGSSIIKKDKWFTDSNGDLFVNGLLGHGSYELVETDPLEGYKPIDPIPFDVDNNQTYIDLGTLIGIGLDLGEIENEFIKADIKIVKEDFHDGLVKLPGFGFNIYKDDASETFVGYFETDVNGEINLTNTRYGRYIIEEVKAVPPYVVADEPRQEVNITEDNKVYSVTFKNKKAVGVIEGHKTTTGTTLPAPDAEYALFHKSQQADVEALLQDVINDKFLTNYDKLRTISIGIDTSDSNGHFGWSEVDLGEYFFVEIKSAPGHNIELTIHEVSLEYVDQDTPVVNLENVIEVSDDLTEVEYFFNKADSVTKKELISQDLEISIYDKDMNLISVLKQDPNTNLMALILTKGTYFYQETKAPSGYKLDKKLYEFTVSGDEEGQTFTIEVLNTPLPATGLPTTGLSKDLTPIFALLLLVQGFILRFKKDKPIVPNETQSYQTFLSSQDDLSENHIVVDPKRDKGNDRITQVGKIKPVSKSAHRKERKDE